MCGIVGLWNLNGRPVDQGLLDRFTDTLAHRGPDGRGLFVDPEESLGLGHRRLAILDTTETGRQPMTYGQGRYWITFNGEIYNFVELKTELEHQGYQFGTHSDTEVILAAYDRWGEDCQVRFNGMWAFAIWDRLERKLFISRDRFGVKPLHYHYDEKHFAFASEMKAFLALDWFRVDFDAEMVTAALSNHHLIEGTERCLLHGLKRLLGGYCLTLKKGEGPKIRRWWNTLEHLETPPQRYEDQIERYRELFLDACRIRMRSDVPIGTALSGGLDSSSILCGMQYIRNTATSVDERLAHDWQRAFVATYPGAVEDERKYAEEVIRHTGVKPTFCEVNPEMYLEYFDRILFQFEELSDVHIGPWLVHKTQRDNHVVVTIDGHGGDESLGGYPWHVTAAMKDAIFPRPRPRRIGELLRTFKGMGLLPEEQFYAKLLQALGARILDQTKDWLRAITGSKKSWLLHFPPDFISPPFEEDKPLLRDFDFLSKGLYIDYHFTLLPTNLRDFDRLSMAHGVEVRSPFMDWRLACYIFSIPSDCKISKGFTKQILRDAMKGILPETIRTRTRKLGFPNPAGGWSLGKAERFIRDSVASREFQESPIWNGRQIVKDLEVAFSERDYARIQKAWTYVQAMSLIKAFHAGSVKAG